jgi:hypothetical protein
MSILEVRPATVTTIALPSTPTTRLAKPYHYRRNGIYYMRLRATGSATEAAEVSLQTTTGATHWTAAPLSLSVH